MVISFFLNKSFCSILLLASQLSIRSFANVCQIDGASFDLSIVQFLNLYAIFIRFPLTIFLLYTTPHRNVSCVDPKCSGRAILISRSRSEESNLLDCAVAYTVSHSVEHNEIFTYYDKFNTARWHATAPGPGMLEAVKHIQEEQPSRAASSIAKEVVRLNLHDIAMIHLSSVY